MMTRCGGLPSLRRSGELGLVPSVRRRRLAGIIACIVVVGIVAGLQHQAWLYTSYAARYLRWNNTPEAFAKAQRATHLAPWYGPGYIALGRAQADDDPVAAIANLALGLRLAPRHGDEGYVAFGTIASSRLHDYQSLLAMTNRGLRWFPGSLNLALARAAALQGTGNYAAARDQFLRAKDHPGFRNATEAERTRLLTSLGECESELFRYIEAASWYRQADALSGRKDVGLARGIFSALLCAGDVIGALEWSQEWNRREPQGSADAMVFRVRIGLGQWDEAMAVLARVSQMPSFSPYNREMWLALAFRKTGRSAEAFAHAQTAYNWADGVNDRLAAATEAGIALVGLGRYPEALWWLAREQGETGATEYDRQTALAEAYAHTGDATKSEAARKAAAGHEDEHRIELAVAGWAKHHTATADGGSGGSRP